MTVTICRAALSALALYIAWSSSALGQVGAAALPTSCPFPPNAPVSSAAKLAGGFTTFSVVNSTPQVCPGASACTANTVDVASFQPPGERRHCCKQIAYGNVQVAPGTHDVPLKWILRSTQSGLNYKFADGSAFMLSPKPDWQLDLEEIMDTKHQRAILKSKNMRSNSFNYDLVIFELLPGAATPLLCDPADPVIVNNG